MKKLADYLTEKTDETPNLFAVVTEENLIAAIEEAHALKHIRPVDNK